MYEKCDKKSGTGTRNKGNAMNISELTYTVPEACIVARNPIEGVLCLAQYELKRFSHLKITIRAIQCTSCFNTYAIQLL